MAPKQTTNLGEWVDQLLETVWFQPDDKLSTKAIQDHFSPDLTVRVNGNLVDYATYVGLIADTRAKNELSVQRNDEILASCDANEGGGGSVAHVSDFTLKDRQTGVEKKDSTVTLATVAVVDGKRVLTELTEVYRHG